MRLAARSGSDLIILGRKTVREDPIRSLLERLQNNETTLEAARSALLGMPFADLGYAELDVERRQRTGTPEVVYAPGKSDAQVAETMVTLAQAGGIGIASRVDAHRMDAIVAKLPPAYQRAVHRVQPGGLLWLAENYRPGPRRGRVAVVSAGTSDQPVASEVVGMLEALGHPVDAFVDRGVAALGRILSIQPQLAQATVVVVVAGMDGALPTVVGGLVSAPVIAVPTSVGYGTSFGGLAALLTMLNGCAPGVTVVNIDGGTSAALVAHRINRGNADD